MRKRNPQVRLQPLGDILFAAMKKRGLAAKLEENALFKIWPKAVGAQIAAQTEPERWHMGTLFVKTTSSIWVQQLHFMKEDILQKMNALAGKKAVKEIMFTVGHQLSHGQGKNRAQDEQRIVLKDRDRRMIATSTAGIADPELATILKRVMEKEISRRRRMEEKQDR